MKYEFHLNSKFNPSENSIKDIIPIFDSIEIYGLDKEFSKVKINNKIEIDFIISEDKSIKIILKNENTKIHELINITLE